MTYRRSYRIFIGGLGLDGGFEKLCALCCFFLLTLGFFLLLERIHHFPLDDLEFTHFSITNMDHRYLILVLVHPMLVFSL